MALAQTPSRAQSKIERAITRIQIAEKNNEKMDDEVVLKLVFSVAEAVGGCLVGIWEELRIMNGERRRR